LNIADYTLPELRRAMAYNGVHLQTGQFSTCVRSDLPLVAEGIHQLYANAPVLPAEQFADFHVTLLRPANLRRWFKPQVEFRFDGFSPFRPLPVDQAFALFEWGLNWCISSHAHQYLMIHAAAIEKNGRVAILPAPPGSGKSTLTAGLIQRGWRLLSDELTLIGADGLIQGIARPVSLKNQSIDVIREFAPQATIGRVVKDTIKGTVAHLCAPTDSVARVLEKARPGWVIFPKYQANAPATLQPMQRSEAFMGLAQNAFNYSLLAADGFQRLSALMDASMAFRFEYSKLDEAAHMFDTLAERRNAAS
jgi:HprK-related kinase A